MTKQAADSAEDEAMIFPAVALGATWRVAGRSRRPFEGAQL